MWSLYRILKPSGTFRVVDVVEKVHPLEIAEAIRILYGSQDVVRDGLMLLDCLYRGLERNYFPTFVKTVGREK